MYQKLLAKIKGICPKTSNNSSKEFDQQPYMLNLRRDDELQSIERLNKEKQELEQVNENLRSILDEKNAIIAELEAAAKVFTPITPISNTGREESDREKRLVNSMLDILTALDIAELDSNSTATFKTLFISLREVISSSLSEYGISLYRDESVMFNPKWHQLIACENTNNPSLNDIIHLALSTGVKIDGTRCLRPEKVSVFKYQ